MPKPRTRPARRPAQTRARAKGGAPPRLERRVGLDVRESFTMAARKPHEQLDQVLRFLQEDLDRLDEPGRVLWTSRLKALAVRPLASPSGRFRLEFQQVTSYDPLPAKSLKALQGNMAAGIREAITPIKKGMMAHAWPMPDLAGGAMFRDLTEQKRRRGYVWQVGIPGEAWPIVIGVAQLVAEHPDRVRACKQCGALFLAVKRQEYCAPEHGQQARDQKKAERKKGGRP